MFVDEAIIFVKAGDGGRGCISFRRTRSNPRGGPNGGSGGRGGDIYVEAKAGLHTLIDYLYPRHLCAENGHHGQGNERTGAKGKDLIIFVPAGTVVYDNSTGRIVGDLTQPGQKIKVCCGGRGGKGNARFATPSRQAPAFSQPGEKGEEKELFLELRIIADVGIVGFPNAGKSTLLTALTSASPKIADYPFTTLSPKLGEISFDHRRLVLAEIPGLIQGSSEGRGLGDRFLRHLDRTGAMIHLIDMSGTERSPWDEFYILRHEIGCYKKEILKRKSLIVANKMDLPQSQENLRRFKKIVKKRNVIPISAREGTGLDILRERLWSIARNLKRSRD